MIIEVDGLTAGLERLPHKRLIFVFATTRGLSDGEDAAERDDCGRLEARFRGDGQIRTDLMVQDAVIPRSRLPEVLDEIYRIADRHNLT